ncbi:MAG TPA: CBS domain-containing protein [Usitatibacter sp.]|nr:CBS domain-containing protein [Usitatibacter sp.]
MKVERICTRSPVAAARSDSLQKAAQTMRRLHVGSLLVTELAEAGSEVVGILTDRDLALLAVADALDVRKVTVDKVMSPVIASVAEDADVLEALERMRNGGIRRLLVTSPDGKAVGMLSIDDVVDGLAAELASAAALMKSEIKREAGQSGGASAAAR